MPIIGTIAAGQPIPVPTSDTWEQIDYSDVFDATEDMTKGKDNVFALKVRGTSMIDALVNDHEGYFQVNVPNNGALAGIPDDVVVELPALINKKGIQTLHVGALPPKVMLEHVLPEWLQMERDLLAFKAGDRSMLLWHVLDSHQTRSYDQAVAVLDDLLAMEGNAELAQHYR